MPAPRKHTAEFKGEAVAMLQEQKLSVAEASRSLGVSQGLHCKWNAQLAALGCRLLWDSRPRLSSLSSSYGDRPEQVVKHGCLPQATVDG